MNDDEQLSFDACGLCGTTSAGVHRRLVEWIEPVDGRRWSYVPRCDERPACRARVEAIGEAWPVNDRTPASTPESSLLAFGAAVLAGDLDQPQGGGSKSSGDRAAVGPHGSRVPGETGSNDSAPTPEPLPAPEPPAPDADEEIAWLR